MKLRNSDVGPSALPLDGEVGDRRIEIGYLGTRIRELRTKDRAATRVYRHAIAFETQTPVYPFDARPTRAIVEDDVLGLDRHQELTRALVHKRKVRQVAFED